MNTTRVYVRQTDEARSAVAEITRLVKGGFVDPIVSFDTETRAIAGLEGYPGTLFDEDGERIKATKKDFLAFTQMRWAESFNAQRLADNDLRVPRRLTTGNELPGLPARAAWGEFWAKVQQFSDERLESIRWKSKTQVLAWQTELEQQLAAQEAIVEQFTGVKGKKKAVEAAQKEADYLKWCLERIPGALARVEEPLDVRLLRHFPAVGVENRVKVDPVRPGLDPYTSEIFTVQITLRETISRELRTWVFNTAKVPLKELEGLFRLGRAYMYLAHNAVFDLKMLMVKLNLGSAPRNIFCTLVGSRMLYLGLKQMSHGLKAVAMRFAGQKMDKAVRDTFIGVRRDEPTQEQIDYGAFDTEVLFPIYDRQMVSAREKGQTELLREFARLTWITAKWEADGYFVDDEKWLTIADEAARDRDQLADQLEEMLLPAGYADIFGKQKLSAEELAEMEAEADEDDEVDLRPEAVIRISQAKLVAERLMELLGFSIEEFFGEGGKPSLKKEVRGNLERAYRERNGGKPHPFFYLYDKWSKRQKQASTYGRKFLWARHPLTGAIHPTLRIAGTDTGRYASTRPNMLNIPAAKEEGDPDFRGAFIAPAGFYFLGGDMEAMELRIAGNVTKDPVVKRMIESGGDPHSFSSAMMFHLRKGNVKEPTRISIPFKYGTDTYTIYGFEVPQDWTAEQVAELALSKEVQGFIKGKTPKFKDDAEEKAWWADFEARDKELARVWKKSPTRTLAKMVTFLWLFRGTPYTLAVRTGLPEEQCEDAFERFNTVYAEMAAGMDRLAEGVLRSVIEGNDGRLYTYSTAYGGLRRWFELPENPSRRDYPQGWSGEAEFKQAQREYKRRLRSIQREACNVPMQGGNAFITARALNLAVDRGYAMGVLPWLAIYDEIIAIAPETVKPEVVKGVLEGSVLDAAEDLMTFIPCGYEADLKKVSHVWVKS